MMRRWFGKKTESKNGGIDSRVKCGNNSRAEGKINPCAEGGMDSHAEGGMDSRTDNRIDPRIVAFIGRHHVLTLATAADGEPWCANMFYAWLDDPGCFIFTSDEATRHVANALRNECVAGSVVLETRVVGRLQGLQFRGVMRRADNAGTITDDAETTGEDVETIGKDASEMVAGVRRAYLKRFPYAAAMPLNLWTIRPTYLKFTDNRLGFGKKLIWPPPTPHET